MANVTGLKQTIADFKKLGVDIEKGVKVAVTTTALESANIATKLAPIQFGKLRQSIGVEKVDDVTQSVVANMFYAPYVEFGTGGNVDVDEEWREIAQAFKGKGVKNINLKPRPFMRPAYKFAKVEFPKRMKNVITNATKSR